MLFSLHVYLRSAIFVLFMVQFSIKYLLVHVDKLGRNKYKGFAWFLSLTSMNTKNKIVFLAKQTDLWV